LEQDHRLGAGVAESLCADPISDKDEPLREAETLVPARDTQVQLAEGQKPQAEAEWARIKSSRSWRLVSRVGRLRGLAAR